MKYYDFYLKWYRVAIISIIVMVAIGGATRLTDSGLSMVDWKPISGVVPPLTESDWVNEFNHYKSFPEYQKINKGLSLLDFKKIFFWEYIHRVFGRIVGLIFVCPFLYLLIKKRINKKETLKHIILIFFVALQGLLGWYMVKSGLVDSPHISHFRLMMHFLMALLLLSYCYYLYLEKNPNNNIQVHISIFKLRIFSVFLLIQIIYGTFVAGLNAGYAYNTYPMMAGSFFPIELFSNNTLFQNLFLAPYSIQYIHRTIGTILLFLSLNVCYNEIKNNRTSFSQSLELQVCSLIAIQFILGVSTLLYAVPIPIAILHQINTCFIVIKCIELHFYSKA